MTDFQIKKKTSVQILFEQFRDIVKNTGHLDVNSNLYDRAFSSVMGRILELEREDTATFINLFKEEYRL